MLTLLKQARAFGVGVVLTTQNPVDLDYKGLTNAGTWFIGKLQTERDKARLLEGLESAMAEAGAGTDTSVSWTSSSRRWTAASSCCTTSTWPARSSSPPAGR